VDLLHEIRRNSLAHQRRETIAFGRRLDAVMEQLFLTAMWRNFLKSRHRLSLAFQSAPLHAPAAPPLPRSSPHSQKHAGRL
jgi:hypothetical protein